MNAKSIIGIILGIILLNNGLYTIIPLPGVISTLAIIVAAILLFMDSTKGGMLGKICLLFGIIIGIYALAAISSFIGISLPFLSFIYRLERLAFIIGGVLLIVSPFVNI